MCNASQEYQTKEEHNALAILVPNPILHNRNHDSNNGRTETSYYFADSAVYSNLVRN